MRILREKGLLYIILSIIIVLIFAFPTTNLNHIYDKNLKENPASPAPNQVNLQAGYKKEPAPMGIADYGIGPHNQPYKYNSSSFEGHIHINSLRTYNNTSHSSLMTFQLNLILAFYNNSHKYVYWVQDVAYLNTSTKNIQFISNIWNMSSSNASMHNSTVSGGEIGNSSNTLYYYDCAGSNEPGNNIKLNYPTNVNLRINSTEKNNVPVVSFEYNDGHGWQTYNNATFKFATNLSGDRGFVVNGYNYTPDNHFYDSELILGGPGGGSSTENLKSNLTLELKYWNNHNYQEITNAYNYGSNTGETIGNTSSDVLYYALNGTIFEEIGNGTGSLNQVYNSNNISLLNVTTTIPHGTVYVNGTPHKFVNHGINLTLAPGNYRIKIMEKSSLYKEYNITLSAGEYMPLNPSSYIVNFVEKGLPANTNWSLIYYSNKISSNSNIISLSAINGTHKISILNLTTYYTVNSTVNINVSGKSVTEHVYFKRWAYIYFNTGINNYNVTINHKEYTITHKKFEINVSAGTYSIKIEKNGYNNYYKNISLSSGQIYYVNASLTKHVIKTPYNEVFGFTGFLAIASGIGIVILAGKRRKK